MRGKWNKQKRQMNDRQNDITQNTDTCGSMNTTHGAQGTMPAKKKKKGGGGGGGGAQDTHIGGIVKEVGLAGVLVNVLVPRPKQVELSLVLALNAHLLHPLARLVATRGGLDAGRRAVGTPAPQLAHVAPAHIPPPRRLHTSGTATLPLCLACLLAPPPRQQRLAPLVRLLLALPLALCLLALHSLRLLPFTITITITLLLPLPRLFHGLCLGFRLLRFLQPPPPPPFLFLLFLFPFCRLLPLPLPLPLPCQSQPLLLSPCSLPRIRPPTQPPPPAPFHSLNARCRLVALCQPPPRLPTPLHALNVPRRGVTLAQPRARAPLYAHRLHPSTTLLGLQPPRPPIQRLLRPPFGR